MWGCLQADEKCNLEEKYEKQQHFLVGKHMWGRESDSPW